METKDLQVENGNYTRIVNPLIEQLIKIPFKGCELAVALYIIRKTYGFQKKEDEISLSQFQQGLERSRQTIVTALKNLQLVQVVRLVQRGSMKGDSNIWAINKYSDTWKLVNMVRLVQRNKKASLTERLNLVQTARHTKETTKESNTKETGIENKVFEEWWNEYPSTKRNVKKSEARKKFEKYSGEVQAEHLERLKDQKSKDRKWIDGFVPNLSTYLNQERWNMDIELPKKSEAGMKINIY